MRRGQSSEPADFDITSYVAVSSAWKMRVVSYVCLFATIAIFVTAFTRDAWWATALQILGALVVGWVGVGLFERASIKSAERVYRGEATDGDIDELHRLGRRAQETVFREAERRRTES